MNKAIILVSSMLLLAGCTHQKPEATPEAKAPETQTQQEASVEYAQVAAAVATGQSAKCVMTAKDGGKIAYSVKGKKMHMVTTPAPTTPPVQATSMILDDEYMYTWTDSTKQGVKFKLSAVEDLKKMATDQGQDVPDFTQENATEKFEELGYTVDCKISSVPDTEFTPPTDVTFSDTSAMMESLGKMQQPQN